MEMLHRYNLWRKLPPALSKEENLRLLKLYKETRDKKIRDKIFAGNLRLVKKLVLGVCEGNLRDNGVYFPSKEDLLESYYETVMKAIEGFDLNMSTSFSTYLGIAIFRKSTHFMKDVCPYKVESLGDLDENSKEFSEILKIDGEQADANLELRFIKEKILPHLPKKQARVFVEHYYLDKPLSQIAQGFGCTREYARLMLKDATRCVQFLFENGTSPEGLLEMANFNLLTVSRSEKRERLYGLVEKHCGREFMFDYLTRDMSLVKREIATYSFENPTLRGREIATRLGHSETAVWEALAELKGNLENVNDLYAKYLKKKEKYRKRLEQARLEKV